EAGRVDLPSHPGEAGAFPEHGQAEIYATCDKAGGDVESRLRTFASAELPDPGEVEPSRPVTVGTGQVRAGSSRLDFVERGGRVRIEVEAHTCAQPDETSGFDPLCGEPGVVVAVGGDRSGRPPQQSRFDPHPEPFADAGSRVPVQAVAEIHYGDR